MSKSGYTCIRYLFCYLNVFLWLSGCGLLGIGLWLRISRGYSTLVPQHSIILGADSILIAIGLIIFLTTFFACCGAWFQSRCMLVTYFSMVVVIFLLEFMLATFAFVYRDSLNTTLTDELLDSIRYHYDKPPDNGLEQVWAHVHSEFHCCGVNNYEDWYAIEAWPGKKQVPASCCLPMYSNTTDCWAQGNQDKWYSKGCLEQVQMWFVSQLHIVGILGLVLSFIQLFGLVSAMLLFCTVKERRHKPHKYSAYTAH